MSDFLNKWRKTASKLEGVNLDLVDPTFWLNAGNYTINKIISGKYKGGFPQGRLSALAGPSAAGKSFVASNVAKFALDSGTGVLYVDTENAIDKGYFDAIGIDVDDENLQYASVSTISNCIKVVSSFMKLYREEKIQQPYIIIIDSLDMLQTDSEAENYDSGNIRGDQGQQAKQLKKMLGAFVQDVKRLNIHILCTKQVYKNQDPISSKQEPWLFTDGIKFAFSQILLVTRLFLKDKTSNTFSGINLKIFGMKTRFTKPFQQCKIEVPYDSGLDPYSGILDAAVSLNIVGKNGGWYTFGSDKFQESNFEKYRDQIFTKVLESEDEMLKVQIDDEEDLSDVEDQTATTKRRQARAIAEAVSED